MSRQLLTTALSSLRIANSRTLAATSRPAARTNVRSFTSHGASSRLLSSSVASRPAIIIAGSRASSSRVPLTIRRALATVTDSGAALKSVGPKSLEFNTNPILNWKAFPDFAAVRPDHVVPAITALVQYIETTFADRAKKFSPSWAGTMGETQDLEDELERASGVITHLSMVKDSPEMRKAMQEIQPMVVKVSLQMGQSLELYSALDQLRNNPQEWDSLDREQKRIVEKAIQGMKLSGVGFGLPGDGNEAKKLRFNEIQGRKAQLSLKFSNNILDATKAFAEIVANKSDLDGCPPGLLRTMALQAEKRGHGSGNAEEGPWAVTLDAPTIIPFMMSCTNRNLREKVYRANVKRASEGDLDNEPIINELLGLRKEEASMLGFSSYGALSLSKKMAANVETATDILEKLYSATLPAAKKDLEEMTKFARQHLDHPTPLQPWDTPYIGEEFRKNQFHYSAEQISEYLVFPRVMQTLFDVAHDSFNISVKEMTKDEQELSNITTWHKDVKVYKVQDAGPAKKLLAYFYGDFYSRSEEKQSGAWMDVCVTRMKDPSSANVRVPIAYMICNQPPPTNDSEPTRMKFQDVVTLFHEFGHCLQHMLTTVDYPQASGIKGVEWDFVEVASQFMENFTYESHWLDRMAAHFKSGDAMPVDMKSSVMKSRECLAGMAMMRQLHFALLDLELHTRYEPSSADTIFDVNRRIAGRTCLVPPIAEDRFLCGFSHIFGGGYAAGYYSYKYSELYSADAYAAIEEQADTEAKRRVGRKYRDTVLAYGGATDPKHVWKEFRGRDGVQVDALLRHSGLFQSSRA
ncbi:hypothetical protein BGW38_002095 [Lunasporangiospora selenospora]|uniref:oligopeptidase A n=1 Tax=Lunasporangiospora selenospora TaxID=979761 RepID=A0A9P6KDT8_9FUNG|nr:hypothetical protein BGW38_002095 [Lunasporangiospora selenospora]